MKKTCNKTIIASSIFWKDS